MKMDQPTETPLVREQMAELLRGTKQFNVGKQYDRVQLLQIADKSVIVRDFLMEGMRNLAGGILALIGEKEANIARMESGSLPEDTAVSKHEIEDIDHTTKAFRLSMIMMHPDKFAELINIVRRLPPDIVLLPEDPEPLTLKEGASHGE